MAEVRAFESAFPHFGSPAGQSGVARTIWRQPVSSEVGAPAKGVLIAVLFGALGWCAILALVL